jgi:hypothetical protein
VLNHPTNLTWYRSATVWISRICASDSIDSAEPVESSFSFTYDMSRTRLRNQPAGNFSTLTEIARTLNFGQSATVYAGNERCCRSSCRTVRVPQNAPVEVRAEIASTGPIERP